MTNNPIHQSFSSALGAIGAAPVPGMQFVESPPTPTSDGGIGMFSPRETMFPRDPSYPFGRPQQVADPRSPPTKGETPIVRSIDELL
jgi:tyrosine-protein phosphatase